MAQIDFLGDPIFQAVDGNGVPIAGGLLWCTDSDTDEPKTMYSTIQDAINQTNPVGNKVVLDSSGRYPVVYAGVSTFRLENSDIDPDTGHGSLIWTAEDIGRFGNTIIDPNGNIIVEYDYQTDAKNYYSIENAPSGQNPIIESKGIDAQIGATIQVKGNTKGLTIKSDTSQYTLPPVDGGTGTFMSTDGAGNVTWAPPPGISTIIPSGTIFDFAGVLANIPSGFLNCDGSAISRSTYSALFTAIGTVWGAGDGVNTFNLPGLQRRTTIGSGGTATGIISNVVGSRGGEENHVLTAGEGGLHNHSYLTGTSTSFSFAGGGNVFTFLANPVTLATGNSGSGTGHNTMQPSAVVLKIIKT